MEKREDAYMMNNAYQLEKTKIKAEDTLKKKQYKTAQGYYKQIEEFLTEPDDFQKYCICLIELNDWDKAIEILKRWEDINSDSDILYSMLGHVYSKKKLFNNAEESYRKGLQIRPDASMYCLLGNVLLNSKKNEAIECFKAATEHDPNFSEAYFNLGLINRESDIKESERYFRKAVSTDHNYVEALAELGFLLAKQKEYIEAEEILKKALKNNEKYLWTIVYSANLFWKIKHFEKAEEMYKKAIEISPEYDDLYKWYADFLNGQGRLQEADKYYKVAEDMAEKLTG